MPIVNSLPVNMLAVIKDIPIYQESLRQGFFPILEKTDIAHGFPDNWMTPRLSAAIAAGAAEFVLSTGTNHARMQIIRPPYFLLNSYYQLWSEHPDLAFTWRNNSERVSLTTVLATEHVFRINAAKKGIDLALSTPEARRLDARTLYLNLQLDPAAWQRSDIERMLDEITHVQRTHPEGCYHLDCSSYYAVHLLLKIAEWDLWERFPQPASLVHAYEYTPNNVRHFLRQHIACPIIDLFGSTELGYLYYSDRHGRYWPYLDKMHLELVPLVQGSNIYSVIVSSVRNEYMPLIRYRSGDCVHTRDGSDDPEKIMRFCGREKEMLHTSYGILAHADIDDLISETTADIFIYQLQVAYPHTRLQYTTFDGAPLGLAVANRLRCKIREATGLDCSVEHCSHIPVGKSGKYAWLVTL